MKNLLAYCALSILLIFVFNSPLLSESEISYKTLGSSKTEPDVIFVPTPDQVLKEMLQLAELKPGELLYDLGSGDGRIVIAAARDFKARAVGVEIEPERVKESIINAQTAGVEGSTTFIQGDLFEAKFDDADVIALYLLSSLNKKLKPHLLERLRPGTRVVSQSFNMGDWEPDEAIVVDGTDVYLWIIPANVQGQWKIESSKSIPGDLVLMQTYQKLIGWFISEGEQFLAINQASLRGNKLKLAYDFNDKAHTAALVIDGDQMKGQLIVEGTDDVAKLKEELKGVRVELEEMKIGEDSTDLE